MNEMSWDLNRAVHARLCCSAAGIGALGIWLLSGAGYNTLASILATLLVATLLPFGLVPIIDSRPVVQIRGDMIWFKGMLACLRPREIEVPITCIEYVSEQWGSVEHLTTFGGLPVAPSRVERFVDGLIHGRLVIHLTDGRRVWIWPLESIGDSPGLASELRERGVRHHA